MSDDRSELYSDRSGKWRWKRIDCYNSKIVGAASQGYVNKSDCIDNAEKNGMLKGTKMVSL